MNLYNIHSEPESLLHAEEAPEIVPVLFWEKYKDNKEELRKRERAIAVDTLYAYYYAAYYACIYARDVLHGPFPAGEAVIAKDVYFAHQYAKYALKKDFYLDGKLIAKFEK